MELVRESILPAMPSGSSKDGATNEAGFSNVKVAVRVRPVNQEERKSGTPTVVACENETKAIKVSYGPAGKKTQKSFNFDKVFGMYSTQEEVFETVVRPIVNECLEGFNCTIFAYGQTGTGKTHTMEGDINSEEHAGIVPRSVKAILENLEQSGVEFTIRVSFLELYNEELQDLLNTSGDKKLKLCEDLKKGVVCQNLEEITVLSVPDIFEILQRGIQQRQTAATLCNKNSSRSHSIFTMKIMIKECNVDGEEVVRHGQLNLVDLAGSECVGRSGAKNDRAREAGSINQSLLTLGRVITALVDHHGHIPYRDSKLTRLLQESLGGKAKTCIIATLSPSQSAVEETLSTLDYAHRAKNIKNQPTLNQRMTKKVVLKEYCAEIEQLKSQLQLTREKNGVYVDPQIYYNMEAKISTQENMLNECEQALKARNDEVKAMRGEREGLFEKVERAQREVEAYTAELSGAKEALGQAQSELESVRGHLRASEAVVSEQVSTESTLLGQGKGLQQEVVSRRADMSALLAKVERLVQQESSRLVEVNDFSGELSVASDGLAGSVAELRNSSKESSVELSQRVAEMVAKGSSTCSALKGSIEQALQVLIGDGDAARVKMVQSSDDVRVNLESTNERLGSTMRALQEQLGSWLGEVDVSMRSVQTQLQSQQQHLDSLVQQVEQQSAVQKQVHAAFIAKQEGLSMDAIASASALKADIKSRVAMFQQETSAKTAAVAHEMGGRVKEMETKMASMLKELLAATQSSFGALSASADDFCSNMNEINEQGSNSYAAAHDVILEGLGSNKMEVDAATDASASALLADLGGAASCRDVVFAAVVGVSGAVGTKRKALDDTVTGILAEVDASIKGGCAAVEDVSQTAESSLGDVIRATRAMNASSGEAIASFTQYLDGNGNELCSYIDQYFISADAKLAASEAAASSLGKKAKLFAESVEAGVLRPTGETPRKTAFADLPSLQRTRDHQIIKQEVLSGVSSDPAAPVVDIAEPAEFVEVGEDSEKSSASKEPEKENSANSVAAAAPTAGLKKPTRGSLVYKSSSQRSLGESDSGKSK